LEIIIINGTIIFSGDLIGGELGITQNQFIDYSRRLREMQLHNKAD